MIDGLVPKLFAEDHWESYAEEVQFTKQIGYQTPPAGTISII
ncbi:hypothetical protein [Ectobacillus panaciterrae]